MKQTVHTPESAEPDDRQIIEFDSGVDSGPAETASESIPVTLEAPEAKPAQADGWDSRMVHWWLLGISATIITLSFSMRSSGEKTVYLPLLNGPLPELCFTRQALNLDCPGCGMTRCFISVSHGQFVRAWQFNPAGFLLYGLIAFQIPFQSIQLWRIYHQRPPLRIPKWEIVFYLLAAVMIVSWAAKLFSTFLY